MEEAKLGWEEGTHMFSVEAFGVFRANIFGKSF